MRTEVILPRTVGTAASGASAAARPAVRVRRWALLAAIAAAGATATIAAMRQTSPTFDEIVLVAGGARGFHTGRFDLAPDHPPLMQYLYGLPAYLSHPAYPAEQAGEWNSRTRYAYARAFFWSTGNDARTLLFRARLVAVAIAAALVLLVGGIATRLGGGPGGAIAALLVAFLPDVLAHGGVAYNDIPLALAYLAALWQIDAALRRPSVGRGAAAGALIALALGVKFSAVVLGPALLLLALAELSTRRIDRRGAGRLVLAVGAGLVAAYGVLVAIYRGDLLLTQLTTGLGQVFTHVEGPGGAPNYFLGESRRFGFWYFFPVAFVLKTPAALDGLIVVALAALALRARAPRAPARLLRSPLRVPVLGGLVFAAALLAARLNIGFRYALPLLPLVLIVVACGVAAALERGGRLARLVGGALLLAYAGSSLSAYPWFLSYTSEFGPARSAAFRTFADSTIDWGQGLYALAGFLHARGIPRVYLSYFGSAPPSAYGIRYVPLPSFFALAPDPADASDPVGSRANPSWAAVSATNVAGPYFRTDTLRLKRAVPAAVVGGSIYLYRCAGPGRSPRPGEIDCARLPIPRPATAG